MRLFRDIWLQLFVHQCPQGVSDKGWRIDIGLITIWLHSQPKITVNLRQNLKNFLQPILDYAYNFLTCFVLWLLFVLVWAQKEGVIRMVLSASADNTLLNLHNSS